MSVTKHYEMYIKEKHVINAQSGDSLKYSTPKLKKKECIVLFIVQKRTALWLCSSLLSQNNISEGHRILDTIKRLFLILNMAIERGRIVIENEMSKEAFKYHLTNRWGRGLAPRVIIE